MIRNKMQRSYISTVDDKNISFGVVEDRAVPVSIEAH